MANALTTFLLKAVHLHRIPYLALNNISQGELQAKLQNVETKEAESSWPECLSLKDLKYLLMALWVKHPERKNY